MNCQIMKHKSSMMNGKCSTTPGKTIGRWTTIFSRLSFVVYWIKYERDMRHNTRNVKMIRAMAIIHHA